MKAWIPSPMTAAAAAACSALKSLHIHESTLATGDTDLISRLSSIAERFPVPRSPQAPNPGATPRRHRPYHYHALMKAFSRAGNSDEVLRLLREMKDSGCKPNLLCYTTVIHSLVVSNRSREAHAVFHEMLVSGMPPDAAACTVLVKLYASHPKQINKAFEIVAWMVKCGLDPDVVTYSTLIAGLCRAGRVDDAWRLLDRMLEMKCTPNAHTYTPISQFYCSRGRIGTAKRLLESMTKAGCSPDIVVYNVLVQALCKAGDFEQVDSLLSESDEKGWKPDAITYNTYINGLCKAGRAKEAFEKLEVMLGKGLCPTGVTLSILLDYLCRESKVEEVKCLLDSSSALGWYVGVDGYNTVMSRLCEVGQWAAVLKLFADMVKKGVNPDTHTFNIVINCLCKAGKLCGAKCMVSSKGFVADTVTYNTLFHAFYAVGRMDEFQDLFSDVDMHNGFPDTVTYNTVIDFLCRSGKYFEAIYFVRSLKDGFSPDLVAHLTHGLVMGGKLGEMLRLYEDMSNRGVVLDVCIFISLIKAFCFKGSCSSIEIYKLCLILDKMLGIR